MGIFERSEDDTDECLPRYVARGFHPIGAHPTRSCFFGLLDIKMATAAIAVIAFFIAVFSFVSLLVDLSPCFFAYWYQFLLATFSIFVCYGISEVDVAFFKPFLILNAATAMYHVLYCVVSLLGCTFPSTLHFFFTEFSDDPPQEELRKVMANVLLFSFLKIIWNVVCFHVVLRCFKLKELSQDSNSEVRQL
ncbi:hypothetical protein QR680_008541 [Steinernema hermaphroditum]|uniref:Uncharacterized protein n=1 Tax=Steinernema hermaphroditum TaxID=289476 RepID=A0AA39IJF0_9BILA|nr:hypothetical protein QR680_008541 [Steinernema hermaphroditum]